ncbi:uncharacterized protein E0L32_005438 [Thyridium curvatum]|uniref:Palmitoyltransferase n=1 Tax=Thyridium curvatum TaxID=1093900 RepID=A0A507B751_9PEZI|nr:uncharacterized protein E0L32_005438 [Thyridium curvatum]TPX14474.1 hypothetical protein E0L32_005438 [Thyridium curvatum]
MSSHDAAPGPPSRGDDELGLPQYPRSGAAGPPSIISSRMTDIASDDGNDTAPPKTTTSQRKSLMASETVSRPGTARTGMSSLRHPFPQGQHLRRGLSGKRTSIGSSVAGSTKSGRPQSSASRSHVPSLTSHAFFHPMSSQRLQAQRGVARPTNMAPQQALTADDSTDIIGDTNRHSLVSNSHPGARIMQPTSDDGEFRPPPSRGTEMTEQETFDRITANTSPTHGHYPTASVSESTRPLQNKRPEGKNLTVRVDKDYKGAGNLPTPIKSPRSFRSSFLLPSKSGSAHAGENRDIQGGEKLDSVASTPRMSHSVTHGEERHGKADSIGLKVGRNFEYFEGNTVFFMGGRFQNTKFKPVNVATGLLTVIPAVLFFACSAPWLWANVSPAIPLVFAYIFYICISSFFHASGSDPGILPRNLHQFPPADENEDPLRLAPPTNDWVLIKSAQSSTAAMEVPTKYCKTCNIWRPPRAHHCRMCDNCIENADHHCVWLNNCMGRRNYRYFFAFVTSLFLMALYVIAACLAQILVYQNRENISFGAAIDHFRVPFALVFYCIIGLLYPAALMGYHLFLMGRGETTREFLNSHKFLKKDRYRAFSQGNWVKNWIVVLCRPRPPTYYRFKQSYTKGDQRLARDRRPQRKVDSKEGLEMQDVKPAQQGFQGPVALRESAPTSA